MKKYNIGGAIIAAAFALAIFAAGPAHASAAVSWNTLPSDCPTVSVGNYTTGENQSATCWGPSVSANPGDSVNVRIYYHNTGDQTASNTRLALSSPSGAATTNTFSGSVSSGASASGQGTVHLSSAQALTFSSVRWYPNKSVTPAALLNGQNGSEILGGGLNIGDILPPSTCSMADTFCHSGSVVVSFVVGNSGTSNGSTCAINSFSPNQTTVTAGSSSMLSWSTTGCTSVSLAGGAISSNQPLSGSAPTGALYSTTTYVLTASGGGVVRSASAIVNVLPVVTTNCAITSFTASPTSVASGSPSTLSWSTTGCTSVSLAGGAISGNQALNGSISTGSLYSTTTYVLSASGTNTTSAQVVVSVAAASNCSINYFNGSPTSVASGSSSTLSWGTSNCTSVSISGGSFYGSQPLSSSGISTGAIYGTTTYVMTASGANTTTAQVVVSVNNTGSCSISYFNANPTVVYSGNSATLTWGASNCTSYTLSGGMFASTVQYGSSVSTGPLYNTTTYTLTAMGTNTTTAVVTVVVNNGSSSNCVINSFYASPTQVPSGSSTTLYWNTSGCSSVYVSGPGVSSSAYTNTISVGPIYGTSNYTLTASAYGSNTVNQTVTVTNTYYNQQNTAPVANTLAATNTSNGAATLNGYISANNSCGSYYFCNSNTTYYFQYGTSQYSLYSQTPTQTFNNSTGNVSAYVSNLTQNTTYYFQLVASNSYGSTYGGTLSFYTGNNNVYGGISAITSLATNVTATSVRLNGLVLGQQNTPGMSAYFEYGTSPALGRQTAQQVVSTYAASNYFDTISTTANTTYYYRITVLANGQTYTGSTVAFTTPEANTSTQVVVTRVVNGTGGGSAYVSLSITDQAQSIAPGDSVNYLITYQNISSSTLSNVVLNTILPTGITFRQASQGVLTTNNTVAASLGTLAPNAQGTITIQAVADSNITQGNNMVTTATIAFTTPSNAQDSAVAYVLNNVNTPNVLAGLALFGFGFFPTTLFGWILLLGLLLVLILIARYFYHRANAARAASAPVTHVYHGAPAPTPAPDAHAPYQGTNLPH